MKSKVKGSGISLILAGIRSVLVSLGFYPEQGREVEARSAKSKVKGSGIALIIAGAFNTAWVSYLLFLAPVGYREKYFILTLIIGVAIILIFGVLPVVGGICTLLGKGFKLALAGAVAVSFFPPIFGPMFGVPAGVYLVLAREDWSQTRRCLAAGGLILLGVILVSLTFMFGGDLL